MSTSTKENKTERGRPSALGQRCFRRQLCGPGGCWGAGVLEAQPGGRRSHGPERTRIRERWEPTRKSLSSALGAVLQAELFPCSSSEVSPVNEHRLRFQAVANWVRALLPSRHHLSPSVPPEAPE